MSVRIRMCEECKKNHATTYAITIPKRNPEVCSKCGTQLESASEAYYFCSFACLAKWVATRFMRLPENRKRFMEITGGLTK